MACAHVFPHIRSTDVTATRPSSCRFEPWP